MNGKHNSLVEFYLNLYLALHGDMEGANASASRVDYERDRLEIIRRARSEGLGFFTKTLPRLGKAVDKALSIGERLQFSNFKKKPGTEIPILYWKLFSRVFDDTGRERSDACALALNNIRQLCLFLYKLELPYDETTANKAIEKFVQTDEHLREEMDIDDLDTQQILRTSRDLIGRVLCGSDPLDIYPKHGPGSVATGERPWEKKFFSRWYRRLEEVYCYSQYFFWSPTHLCDRLQELEGLRSEESGTAKVVLVPKDSRGPRIISCEPLENQWIQQGQKTKLVQTLESHSLTRGKINFTEQSVNRDLALTSSRDGRLCTLDMQEASDRVSLDLVAMLFPRRWSDALYASRSSHTRLPCGTIMPLNKFAPMGSAVCFPVEALVFWALSVSVIMRTRGVSLAQARKDFYVYGDDIICSSDDQAAIRHYLPKFGLKVNDDKSCTHGFFRESCGCDAFKGVDVTPLKISEVWCHPLTVGPYESYVEYSNSLYARGYYGASKFLEDAIQRLRLTPYTERKTNGISFIRAHVVARSENRKRGIKMRFNSETHRLEVRGYRSRPIYRKTADSDWEELLRVASVSGVRENPLEGILQRRPRIPDYVRTQVPQSVEAQLYAVPHRNRLQMGWIGVD